MSICHSSIALDRSHRRWSERFRFLACGVINRAAPGTDPPTTAPATARSPPAPANTESSATPNPDAPGATPPPAPQPPEPSDADTTGVDSTDRPTRPTLRARTPSTNPARSGGPPIAPGHTRDRRTIVEDLQHGLTALLHQSQLHEHRRASSDPASDTNRSQRRRQSPPARGPSNKRASPRDPEPLSPTTRDSVAQLPGQRPPSVSQLPGPQCQASTGTAHDQRPHPAIKG
jgi:hypothetical protein